MLLSLFVYEVVIDIVIAIKGRSQFVVACGFQSFTALKAAIHNYPMIVLSFWDQICDIVAVVVDTGWEKAHSSPTSPAKGVLSAGYAQPSRICDDKLVQSANKVS